MRNAFDARPGGVVRSVRFVPGAIHIVSIVSVVLCTPTPAFANMALPMVVVAFPGMVVALPLVLAIEAAVLGKVLGLRARRALGVAAVSNLVTTLLGVPVLGVLQATLSIGVGAAMPLASGILERVVPPDRLASLPGWVLSLAERIPWALVPLLGGWFDDYTTRTQIAMTLVLTLIPFFFMSWWIEYLVSRRMLRDQERRRVSKAVLIGNAYSYVLLAVWMVVVAALR